MSEALDTIGAPRTADIVRRAIDIAFPFGLLSITDDMAAAATEFSNEVLEQLDTLDRQFFEYPHNLTDLLFAYVSEHPDEFGELPNPDDK